MGYHFRILSSHFSFLFFSFRFTIQMRLAFFLNFLLESNVTWKLRGEGEEIKQQFSFSCCWHILLHTWDVFRCWQLISVPFYLLSVLAVSYNILSSVFTFCLTHKWTIMQALEDDWVENEREKISLLCWINDIMMGALRRLKGLFSSLASPAEGFYFKSLVNIVHCRSIIQKHIIS